MGQPLEPIYDVNIEDWEAKTAQDPVLREYSLGYLQGRQLMGLSHEQAVQYGQQLAYGKIRSRKPQPANEHNERFARVRRFSELPSDSPVIQLQAVVPAAAAEQTAPLLAEATAAIKGAVSEAQGEAAQAEAYNQLRLALESRRNGKFASPTKVSNPEVVSAAMGERLMDMPQSAPSASADQLELLDLLEKAETRASGQAPLNGVEVKANAEAIANKIDAMSERTRSGRRLAGGYAVTGGLGLLGLLGLAALTDPYQVSSSARSPEELAR